MFNRSIVIICPLFLMLLYAGYCSAAQSAPYSLDLLAMQGTWIRSDAPYRLEISPGEKNTLDAKYFNKKYINVEETLTEANGGFQYIMIRLRDVNYAGSFYVLRYDRERDILLGLYTLGGTGQEFQVMFNRKKTDS